MGDFSESSLLLTQFRSLEFTLCYCEVMYFSHEGAQTACGQKARRLFLCSLGVKMVLTLESQGEGFVTWDMMGHSHSVSTEDGSHFCLRIACGGVGAAMKALGAGGGDRQGPGSSPALCREHVRASAGGEREGLGRPEVTQRTHARASCRALVSGLCVALRLGSCGVRSVLCAPGIHEDRAAPRAVLGELWPV